MKWAILAFVCFSMLAIVPAGDAKTYTGSYTFVKTEGNVVVFSRMVYSGEKEFRFETDGESKIVIDGKPANIEDLKPGDKTNRALRTKADPTDNSKLILVEADITRQKAATSQPSK